MRSLLVAIAVGVAAEDDPDPLILYGLAAAWGHVLATGSSTLVAWVLTRPAALGVRNVGANLRLTPALERAKRTQPAVHSMVLANEWLLVLGLAIVLPGDSSSQALVTAVGVALMLATALVFVQRAWHLISGERLTEYDRGLFEELMRYEPEALVYVSVAAGQSGYMLNQWLPALARMRTRAMIVVREPSNIAPLAETPLPMVLARATRDLERLVLPSVKMAIYVANSGGNVQLLREPRIKHVFLNHGDSDKATSANPVSRVYDEVWVAGQAGIDRYDAAGVHIPPERFAIVGRPQVEGVPVGPRERPASPRVLYAPTWEGIYEEVNYSSLERAGPLIVESIVNQRPDIGVTFKPHPASGSYRPGMRTAQLEVERVLRNAPNADQHLVVDAAMGITLNDCFAAADVLISDVSSVVTDFLHTERPIIVSNPIALEPADFHAMFPTQRASYVLAPPYGEVCALVERALGDDPLAAARVVMKRYVLGDLPCGSMAAFAENVERVCATAVQDREKVRNDFMFSPAAVAERHAVRPSLAAALRQRR